jgi:hypothetical protein
LKNERFTIITHGSDEMHHRCSELLNASTPSLCNGGRSTAEHIFGYNSKKTDKTAMQLVERFCKTGADLGEAANSLIILGVPSRSVMLKALREVKPFQITHGLAYDGIYSVLGDMGDPESIGVLCDRLRQVPSRYVVYSLAGKSHPKLGPALHAAIRNSTNDEDIAAIASAIGYQKYLRAAPDVAAAFERIKNPYYAGDVAHALAALNYREAIPLIEKAVAKLPANANDGFRNGGLRVALQRFNGDWGIPSESVRIQITGAEQVRAGEKAPLSIYVENIGEEPIWTWHGVEYGLQMNGKPLIEKKEGIFFFHGLSSQTPPGGVMTLSYDLGPHLLQAGEYKIQYGDGKKALLACQILFCKNNCSVRHKKLVRSRSSGAVTDHRLVQLYLRADEPISLRSSTCHNGVSGQSRLRPLPAPVRHTEAPNARFARVGR